MIKELKTFYPNLKNNTLLKIKEARENIFLASFYLNFLKELVLFDTCLNKQGILSPKTFIKEFGDLDFSAKLIMQGKLNKETIEKIRNKEGEFSNLEEGVIVKSGERHKLWMAKIKTMDYLEKLKHFKQDSWKDFW